MQLKLKDFQENAVQQLMARADQSASEVEKIGDPQALILAAPTGSGKTAMATSLLERMVKGDNENDPVTDATFLWLTDQPELNEQTRRKLAGSSDFFDDDRLITIEASKFNQETLDPGCVYFLNTQKLGRKSSLVKSGDKRQSTMWQTIANTVAERPHSFWLIIDEAHRGMMESAAARKEAQTISQKFIKGSSEDGLPPVPLIFGISATPQRFYKLLEGVTPARTQRAVTVDPELVRESGLLKDSIILHHTDEDQPSDLTLLAAAAEKLSEYRVQWAEYATNEDSAEVRPVLVVQVQDGTKAQLTKTDLSEVLSTIEKVLGRELEPKEVAHAFQEGGAVEANGYSIPYLAPSDIEQDPNVCIVLFKMALTTGWDCPRAEVMMSFRPAQDQTLIAQLVGRMVRTPLARQVTSSDLLNAVSLYLPYYDEKALDKVIETLSEPDPDQGLAGTRVERGNNLVTLKQNPKTKAAFEAAEGLPLQKVQRVTKQGPIKRLMRLGRRLSWDGLDTDASAKFERELVKLLDAKRKNFANDKDYKQRYDEAGRIDVRSVTVEVGKTNLTDEQRTKLPVLPRNVEHAFDVAGRRLGGGLHTAYLKHRAAADKSTNVLAIKRELFALLQNGGVLKAVQDRATELADVALAKHKTSIDHLPEEKRLEYRQLRLQGDKPVDEPWELPATIEGPKKGDSYKGHMYVKKDGDYACVLNAWEKEVIAEVLADASVVGWLRNDPRKPWAFSVSYFFEKEDRPMYPDFIIFRKDSGHVVCDIIEPHSLSFADSAAKAKGLADFAHEHGQKFGRILLLAKANGSKLKALPLHKAEVGNEIRGIKDNERLKEIVAKF